VTEWSWAVGVVSQSDRNDRNPHAFFQSELSQAHQSLFNDDRLVITIDASLRKNNQLLIVRQQIQGKTKCCQRWLVLVNGETSQPLEKPALQARHFCARHHESTVTSGNATPRCHGQHQGIPSGSVGRCKENWTLHRKMLEAKHNALAEVPAQREILSDHHGQWRPERVNARFEG